MRREAFRIFKNSGLEHLALGHHVLHKKSVIRNTGSKNLRRQSVRFLHPQKRLGFPSRGLALSLFLLVCGTGIVALVLVQLRLFSNYEKVAIVGSALGFASILAGIHLLADQDRASPLTLSRPWLRYLPLLIGFSVTLGGDSIPPLIATVAFAAALALLFILSKATNVSRTYLVFSMLFLAGAIGYNAYFYYFDTGAPDIWGYLSVGSAIIQTGRFSNIMQPTDRYYYPFPVMSIASTILSSTAGLDLRLSLLIFPGSLVLLQPLFVFILARVVYSNSEAAAFSAFIVLTESAVTRFIATPGAESVALSLLLLVLFLLSGRVQPRGRIVGALLAFLMLVVISGAVGLLSAILVPLLMMVRRTAAYKSMRVIMPVVFFAYLLAVALVDRIVYNLEITAQTFLGFVLDPIVRIGTEVYGAGGSGLLFMWWGLPVSLALLSILLQRTRHASFWAYAGLGLLGISFIANVISPDLIADRYVGVPAWIFLAVGGGLFLSTLTRSSRRVLMVLPIIFLACSSAVADPGLSPQYGFGGSRDLAAVFKSHSSLPMTEGDRIALDWLDGHVIGNVTTDGDSAFYLTFSRYRSGVFSVAGILRFTSGFVSPTRFRPDAET